MYGYDLWSEKETGGVKGRERGRERVLARHRKRARHWKRHLYTYTL